MVALGAIKDFKGVTGTISFDADGNPVKSVVVPGQGRRSGKYIESVTPFSSSSPGGGADLFPLAAVLFGDLELGLLREQ
jgi:hypothetical protein